jgi:hypothetical protein
MTSEQHTHGDERDDGAGTDEVTAFADRVFASALGGIETLSIYLGDRLGWYRALAEGEPLDAPTLAARTGTDERYAREWLEQQAVSGILTVDDADAEASARRFSLPPAHAEVLADADSLDHLAPLGRFLAATAAQLPALLDAYRTGGGVAWAQLGEDARDAQGDINRPWFLRELAPALATVPSLHSVLSRPGARVADVGSGHGRSRRRAATRRRRGSPTGCGSTTSPASPSLRRTSSTPRSSSRRCTTCPSPSKCSRRSAGP